MDRILKHPLFFLIALSLFLVLWGNWSLSLTDPDEVFYSLTAREMLKGGHYLIPHIFGAPQFEKPPLYYWLLMVFSVLSGGSAFAARMPAALFATAAVAGTFYFVRKVANDRAAFLCGLIMATSLWWVGLSKAVLIDMMFGVLCGFATFSFYLWYLSRKNNELLKFALWTSLAVLAKGPLGLAFPLISALGFLLVKRDFGALRVFVFNFWWLLFGLIAVPWYAYTFALYGREFWEEFFIRDHWMRFLSAEHTNFDRWFFYPVCMIVSLLPWSVFAGYLGRGWREKRDLFLYLLISVIVVFAVCQVAHSKLATYIAPLYPALIVLFGLSLSDALEKGARKWPMLLGGILCFVLGAAFLAAPFIAQQRFPDLFTSLMISVLPAGIGFFISGWKSLKGNLQGAFVSFSLMMPLFILVGGVLAASKLEGGFSDSDLPAVISSENYGSLPIVASKLYARGVNFHSGNPVVVLSGKAQPFWSPHPVPVIFEEGQIREYFERNPRVLAVLGEKDFIKLKGILGEGYSFKEFSSKFGRVVLLVTRP